jgi:phosphate/phosphite/phosphonate ABC transporter binding protein
MRTERCRRAAISLLPWLLALSACDPSLLDDPLVGPRAVGAAVPPLPEWPAELPRLRLGLIPVLGPDETARTYQPLIEYLGTRLGVPAELVVADDYGALTALLRDGRVDAALFTALSYVEAHEQVPDLLLLLKQVVAGAETYVGYVYTTREHPAESVEGLAGAVMCWVDPQSTSGYLFPRALLRQRGRDPDRFFGHTEQGGNHLECLERVLDGRADAAATYAGAFATGRTRGLPVERIKIVGKTRRIPYNALVARPGLPAAAAARLKGELLRLSTLSQEGQRSLSADMRLNAWAEAENADYDDVRRVQAEERATGARR